MILTSDWSNNYRLIKFSAFRVVCLLDGLLVRLLPYTLSYTETNGKQLLVLMFIRLNEHRTVNGLIEQDGNVPSRRHILGSKIFKEQLLEKFGKKFFFKKKILIFFSKKSIF